MATYDREILRLAKLGYSQRSIASSAGCARSTVQRVFGTSEIKPAYFLALSDKGIQQALFPAASLPSMRKAPNYEHVHRELSKNGVTLSLLWNEYCEECYASKEIPLMFSSASTIGNTPGKRKLLCTWTTNLPFSKWTDLFENTTMAAALIDRLTYQSHVLDMNGDSYRLKATLQSMS